MPRPSGIRHTPARASASGATPVTSRPQRSKLPDDGHDLARRDRERRRLARAVRPEQREDLARREREVDAVQHVDAAVAGAHRRELEHRDSSPAARRRVRIVVDAVTAPACGGAEVRALHRGSAWISSGVPLRDDAAEVEHVDVRARPITSGMSCSTSRTPSPSAASSCSRRPSASVSSLVETRRRLVEQEHLGSVASARGELDEARGAGGQRVDLAVGDRADADPFEQLVGDRRRRRSALRPAPAHLERDEHVLARGEAAERLEPLERARDAEPRPRCGAWRG